MVVRLGSLLASLAWALIAPAPASAGCPSDHLPSVSLSGEPGFDLSESLATAQVPGRPVPCTGEMCSSRPAMPMTSATPDVQRAENWAILTIAPPLASAGHAGSPPGEGHVRPILAPPSIFRPPPAPVAS